MDREVTGCSGRLHSALFTNEVALQRKTSLSSRSGPSALLSDFQGGRAGTGPPAASRWGAPCKSPSRFLDLLFPQNGSVSPGVGSTLGHGPLLPQQPGSCIGSANPGRQRALQDPKMGRVGGRGLLPLVSIAISWPESELQLSSWRPNLNLE